MADRSRSNGDYVAYFSKYVAASPSPQEKEFTSSLRIKSRYEGTDTSSLSEMETMSRILKQYWACRSLIVIGRPMAKVLDFSSQTLRCETGDKKELTEMISILFVDDEPNILEGLQRMLRNRRHEWQMSFAGSGIDALAILGEKRIDVVVSDMKMPGMDGAELLRTVSERYPHIVRVILSGFSEQEADMKSVGTAHQYLSKPCDPELLKSTIARVCALRELLTNQTLRRLVSQLPSVPSLPTLYTELVDELGKAESSTKRVADIVRKDLGMTVKILQMVNSAFFGIRRHISDSRLAVEFLGMDTISSLTLGLGVISQFENHASGVYFADVWAHSMAIGVAANSIANLERKETGNDAFTAGLLHDIGKVILAANLPSESKKVREIVQRERLTLIEGEKEVFGASHAYVGAYLLGLWGLPSEVVQAVAFHHTPRDIASNEFTALTAVHAANGIHHGLLSASPSFSEPHIDRKYLKELGLLNKIPLWQQISTAASADSTKIAA